MNSRPQPTARASGFVSAPRDSHRLDAQTSVGVADSMTNRPVLATLAVLDRNHPPDDMDRQPQASRRSPAA